MSTNEDCLFLADFHNKAVDVGKLGFEDLHKDKDFQRYISIQN